MIYVSTFMLMPPRLKAIKEIWIYSLYRLVPLLELQYSVKGKSKLIKTTYSTLSFHVVSTPNKQHIVICVCVCVGGFLSLGGGLQKKKNPCGMQLAKSILIKAIPFNRHSCWKQTR